MIKKKVLLLGSGGLKIGQAGEFDYSGTQAIKALKEECFSTILLNPNIATCQTDPHMADKLYLSPLNFSTASKIIEKERPDAILLNVGGQTALNLGLLLEEKGILQKFGVKVLGTSIQTIRLAEDRKLFKQELDKIGVHSARSFAATTVAGALEAAEEIGYPVMMRCGFSLGGLGSGKVTGAKELALCAQAALSGAPQILIEEYLFGWKEVEYEIVRDSFGNALSVCNMENLDPMGIHTGESIVVAPSQTLSNEEYHRLRAVALKVAAHLQIVGECNIQYALCPKTGAYRVIELNPRLSRSSALASKATGYPLAFVATKLALGKRLDELQNSVTKKTTAFFEPSLDYLVVKMPRWDIQKLARADRTIGTEMKSVGEVMAIGRSFPEALQKAVRMANIGATGLFDYPYEIKQPEEEISRATDRRLFALASFFRSGGTVETAHELSQIDFWFLHHIQKIVAYEQQLATASPFIIKEAKKLGFSDKTIAKIQKLSEEEVRAYRLKENITPVIKQIDTLAGEFASETNYLYMTYHGKSHDVEPAGGVMVMGSGPYCIGSSVEFDWCSVNTVKTLKDLGKKTILINSNPETVSTDFDESDRLFFEELTFERIRDIADFEAPEGIILSMGGQIANNLALPLYNAGYPLLGTDAKMIDQAENREKFSSLLHTLKIDQPEWQEAVSIESAKQFAAKTGYPVIVRPSYVLSGAAMNIVYSEADLKKTLQMAALVSPEHPVVLSKFIANAKELEVDGVASKGELVIEAITEHIENAGIHSGDATLVIPPQRLYLETIRRTKAITAAIVRALAITGPFNIQFIAQDNRIQVIECNLRAARSFPFVSKVTRHNFIRIAVESMLGSHKGGPYETLELDYVGVKTPQFSYSRLKGANPVAHVEMASTGEVACIADSLMEAFYASWLSTEQSITGKKILVSIGGEKKVRLLPELVRLEEMGWEIFSTENTHDFLCRNGVASNFVYKGSREIEPNVLSLIANRDVDIIINIPRTQAPSNHQTDGFKIRRLAIDHNIPLITNLHIAHLFLQCLTKLDPEKTAVKSWQEYGIRIPNHIGTLL